MPVELSICDCVENNQFIGCSFRVNSTQCIIIITRFCIEHEAELQADTCFHFEIQFVGSQSTRIPQIVQQHLNYFLWGVLFLRAMKCSTECVYDRCALFSALLCSHTKSVRNNEASRVVCLLNGNTAVTPCVSM